MTDILNDLQKRNDGLKSRLLHEQLKFGNYSFSYYDKYSGKILREFNQTHSLVKSASNVGIDYKHVLNWYFQGQMGNKLFRDFYLSIKNANNNVGKSESETREVNVNIASKIPVPDEIPPKDILPEGEYLISQYGTGWSYKTFIDGEKIFLISDDLERLKEKVKSQRLPLD